MIVCLRFDGVLVVHFQISVRNTRGVISLNGVVVDSEFSLSVSVPKYFAISFPVLVYSSSGKRTPAVKLLCNWFVLAGDTPFAIQCFIYHQADRTFL